MTSGGSPISVRGPLGPSSSAVCGVWMAQGVRLRRHSAALNQVTPFSCCKNAADNICLR